MRRRGAGGLVALNVALLGLLVAVSVGPGKVAEARQGARARGQYTMGAGHVLGSVEDAVYVVDAANLELLALRFDNSRKELQVVGYRDLSADTGRPGAPAPR